MTPNIEKCDLKHPAKRHISHIRPDIYHTFSSFSLAFAAGFRNLSHSVSEHANHCDGENSDYCPLLEK